jgi:broad specificity phosphatase PhoE
MTHNIDIDTNIFDNDYKNGRKGMNNKKIINRIVLVRHGETMSNIDLMNGVFDENKHDLDTLLSNLGNNQSVNIGNYLKKINFLPNIVIVSKLQRTYETALPTLLYLTNNNTKFDLQFSEKWTEINLKKDTVIVTKYDESYWIYKKETREEFIYRVWEEFQKIKNKGSVENPIQILCFTHSQVISTILANCMEKCINLTNETKYHLSNGSITCIDVTEDLNLHVQEITQNI